MSRDEGIIRCPTCGKKVDYRQRAQYPHFPFCSERCKLIDLGKWLDGEHRIEEALPETPPTASKEDPGQGQG